MMTIKTQLIQKHGYPVETHSYETDDGYILKAYRIPHGRTSKQSKESVVLVHGMGGSGENFLILGPPDALAYYLADRGYDVWLFNARGTTASRRHRSINVNRNRRKFYDFSFHEIGIYDLPATIDYILKKTERSQVYYVGHSQGTTTLMLMLSKQPEMNDKIRAAALLAPSAFLNYTHSPLILAGTKLYPLGEQITIMFNWYELPMPNSPLIPRLLKELCRPEGMRNMCVDIINLIGGTDSQLVNHTLLPMVLEYAPQGFATKGAWHYAQIILTGRFQEYDYGKRKNLKLYNSEVPPEYNLANCKAPIALFYSPADPFSNVKMAQKLKSILPNVVLDYEIPIDNWNHLDHLVAYNVSKVVYARLYDMFKTYEK